MGQESTNFSYFLGGLALMSTVISLALCSRTYLPSSQMKILDDLLHETRQIYESSVSEDLIPGDLKSFLGDRLTLLERLREQNREQCYRAITIFDQYIALIRGLSVAIVNVSALAKQLRAEVVTTSEQTKRRRENDRRTAAINAQTTFVPNPISNEGLTTGDSPAVIGHSFVGDAVEQLQESRATTLEIRASTLVEHTTEPPPPCPTYPWYSPQRWKSVLAAPTKYPTSDVESNISSASNT